MAQNFWETKEMTKPKNRSVPVEEYAMLRNLESMIGSLFRLQPVSLKQLTGTWLWPAIQEQLKSLARERSLSKWEKG